MNSPRPQQSGLTLIELLIVVVIIGILSAVAVPSYLNYLAEARRTDAEAVLVESAQVLERYYTEQNTYVGGSLPFAEAPKDGTTKYFDISFGAGPTATSYTIRAVPKGAMLNDACGTLTLTNTGVKGSAGAVDTCWRR